MLAEDLEDDPGNATRFAWLARAADAPAAPESGPAKTMIVFWGAGSSSPGWLVSCLAVFAFAGVNLTRIESRPLRRGMGEYMFFLDLEGSMADSERLRRRRGPPQARRGGSSPRLFLDIRTVLDGRYTPLSDGERRTPRPTGVRAARRPPAART